MLLDPETWDLVQHIEAVLAAAAEGEYAERVHSELMQSVVEITTPGLPHGGRGGRAAAAAPLARGGDRAQRGLPLRLGRHASVQPVRAPADHGQGPLPRGSSSSSSTSPAAS